MMKNIVSASNTSGPPAEVIMKTIRKEILIKGKPKEVDCLAIGGQTFTVSKGLTTVVRLEEEWYEGIPDPKAVVAALSSAPLKADIFTFWQRFPNIIPIFSYYHEFEPIAVLPIKTYDQWFNNAIKSRTRGLIRKAEKRGVIVSEASFDDAFVQGMTEIFNESPLRQGRRFWHYGKSFDTVKQQFSRYLFREYLIGAYLNDELVGFMMIADAAGYALTGQILSKIQHRDKAINNALIAKAVELCERKGIPYLIYLNWGTGSFSEFKRRCGFQKVLVPRYFVPMTRLGRIVIRLGLHRGFKEALPESVKENLKALRSAYFDRRSCAAKP
jgi:hypothetical protein